MEPKIDVGDEVIDPPEKTKVGDKIAISGYVTRIDEDIGKLTFRIGGLITVDIKSIVAHRKNKTPAFKPSRPA